MISSKILTSGEPSKLGFAPERFELLHRRIQQFVDDGQHAGVSLLLMRNGETADAFAAGLRNRELGLPMSRDTIVRVYSMTKIVVSVAALTLLEKENWDYSIPLRITCRSSAICAYSWAEPLKTRNWFRPTNR